MYWNSLDGSEELSSTRLTLTWDVLKYKKIICIRFQCKININMRCIEIWFCQEAVTWLSGLTLTWDVLKWRQMA